MVNEKKMVSQVIAGDMAAFALLVRQYERLVFHIVGRLVENREDAKDVCQEVFISVYKGLPGFAFQSKLSSWIGRIAWRTAVSYLRKYKKSRMSAWPSGDACNDYEQVAYETPHDTTTKKELFSCIHRLIKQLPDRYKTVVTLYHFNEYSYHEIAAATGLPDGTVKGNLFRARKLLREKLEVHLGKELV